MRWEVLELGSLCEITSSKRIFLSDYVEDGIPFYRGKEIIQKFRVEAISEPYFITVEKFIEISQRFGKPEPGDILLTAVGTLGFSYLVKEEDGDFYFKDGNLIWLRNLDKDKVHPKFLSLLMRSTDFQAKLDGVSIGSSQKALTIKAVKTLKVDLPPLPTQRRIASILSAYDDLIENNLRRIKLLEEAAQHIYREWFVRMRFPGWETVEFGTDGLPEGWRNVLVEQAIEYHIGGGWGNEDVNGDFVQPAFVIRGTDIPKLKLGSAEGVPFRYHTTSNFKSRKLQENDLVFEVSGGSKGQPVGRSLLVTEKILQLFGEHEVVCASFCKLIRIDSFKVSPHYFDAYILDIYGNGVLSQYENQSASNIMNFKFTDFINKESLLVPPKPIQEMFDKCIRPLKDQIGNLAVQITRLKEARDILLPRLMNQTIEV